MTQEHAALEFEHAMMLLFGDKAYQIAGQETNPTRRRRWLNKAIFTLSKEVMSLDTAPRHKQLLLAELDLATDLLNGASAPSWSMIYRLVRVVSRLCGFDDGGKKCHTPTYFQTRNQYYTQDMLDGGDALQSRYDRRDAVSIQRSIVRSLKKNGLDDFKISLVLNISEYAVKQLKSGVKHGSTKVRRQKTKV